MSCEAIRDVLPEHALGVSGMKARAVSEHLARCAACRKESRDLQRAAATFAFALAPTGPAGSLEEDVVRSVRSAAGTLPPARRPRRVGTVLLAATLALAGIGGGAVVANRDRGPTPDDTAGRREDGLDALQRFYEATKLVDDASEASLGVLLPDDGRPGGGSAMTLISPSIRDRAIVVASGLPDTDERLPYTVWLANAQGAFVRVGNVKDLDTSGGFTVARIIREDLRTFVNVLVRDARGKVVLSGTLEPDTLATPSA